MKRYYMLMNKRVKQTGVGGDIYDVIEWNVVRSRGEPIGDNCFYQSRKWCGDIWYFLYDAPTGVYICREPTLKDLQYHVVSEEFKNQLERTRKSDSYKLLLRTFDKAMKEYEERVKGGKENDK